MKRVVISMTQDQFGDLYQVVFKARQEGIRPAKKVLESLSRTMFYVDEGETVLVNERGLEHMGKEAQEPSEEPPGPQHEGMRPIRGRRQPT